MTGFVAPVVDDRCPSTLDGWIRCQLDRHNGPHRNGPLIWHEPPLILVGGHEPDLTIETERWQNRRVLLAHEVEPDL